MTARALGLALVLLAGPAGAHDLPDPKVTPGSLNPSVTQATIAETICVRGWASSVRPSRDYTGAIKRRLAGEAGVGLASAELDHLISIELGGDPRDPANLWLQHWDGPRGARVKDALENELNRRVCDGRLSLDEAQQMIRTDWIAAYERIFGGSPR